MRNRAAAAALVVLLPGCALIRQGTTQVVTFKSKPPQAEIWINGKKHPKATPATLELPKHEQAVVFKLKGYYDKTYWMSCKTSSYFYWSLLMGVIAGGVDWISGAWKEFDIPENGEVLVVLDAREDNPLQTVGISSNPNGASIKIDGFDRSEKTGVKSRPTPVELKWGSGDREKRVILKLEGYEDAQLSLVRGTKTLDHVFVPSATPVRVQFESNPPGAEVLIDGVRQFTTPFSHQLDWYRSDNPRKVEFRKDGYESWSRTITAEDTKVVANLKERVNWVTLNIDCSPAGATLEVDGKPAGFAPAAVDLDWSVNTKSHTLKLTRPGYEVHVELVEDPRKPVSVRLRPSLPRLP